MKTRPLETRMMIRNAVRLAGIILAAEVLIMLTFGELGAVDRLAPLPRALLDGALLFLISAYPVWRWVGIPLINEGRKTKEKTEMLANALENAGEGVLITDPVGTILYVNKAFVETTGFTASEAIGQNPRILQSGKQDSGFYRRMWQTISNKGVWRGELWNRRKNGELYPEILQIRSIRDDDGGTKYLIGVFSDNTERMELEKSIRQSQKLEALGTLVGGVAHNFNNLLAAIVGKAYLGTFRAISPEAKKILEEIHQLGQNGASLVNQLLSFAREGHHEMRVIPFVSLVDESLKTASIGIPESIQISSELPEQEIYVRGDESQLQQVIMNLLNNARDAVSANEGDKTIHVSLANKRCSSCDRQTGCDLRRGEAVSLAVTDNGCGISDEDREKIFDPFFTTKSPGKGTGLGLSMSMGTVKAHGGTIHVEEQHASGSRFLVCLPKAEFRKIETEVQTVRSSASDGQTSILLIEDEANVRATLAEILDSLGYQILTAKDGHDGVETFLEHQQCISLVISDVVMPRMNGLQTLQAIRNIAPDVPAIMMTGYDRLEDGERPVETDNTKMIRKPFDVAAISQLISRLLDSQAVVSRH